MRWLAVLALTAIVVAGSAFAGVGTSSTTALTIAYWEKGLPPAGDTDPVTWTLRCGPARGTLPRPAVACSRLAASGRKLLTPVPSDAICTQIYGGPQIARVVGIVDGKRVWATFSRTNGCHIARWNRLFPWLLPRGGSAR